MDLGQVKLIVLLLAGVVLGATAMNYGGYALLHANEVKACADSGTRISLLDEEVACYQTACTEEAKNACTSR